MKKTGLQILSEIRESLDALNVKIAEIEIQLAELEGFMDFEDEIDEAEEPQEEPAAAEAEAIPEPAPVSAPVAVPEPVVEAVDEPEPVVESVLEPETEPVPEPVEEPGPVVEVLEEPEPVIESVPEPEPVPEPETLETPMPEMVIDADIIAEDIAGEMGEVVELPELIIDQNSGIEESINDVEAAKVKSSVNDALTADLAWKHDIPGSQVKNILSAISLNDRLLFIKNLFNDDPYVFQQTIVTFNGYESFGQAEAYVLKNFPNWKLQSETVYRFMMAVRRKFGK